MSFPPIAELVPHAAPMLLLDRVISADADSLCAAADIDDASLFLTTDRNGMPGVNAWVGIEYMAQAVAAYAGLQARRRGDKVKVGFLLGTRVFAAHQEFFPAGGTLHVDVRRVLEADNGLGSFDCSIRAGADTGPANGRCLAQATLTVFQPDDIATFLQEGQA